MHFDLVDSRHDLNRFAQVGQHLREKVCHTDCFYEAFPVSLFHAAIGCEIILHRLMQQNKINILHIEFFKRCSDCLVGRLFVFLILHPDLGRDKKLFPRNKSVGDRAFYRFADSLLIHVGSRRIDQAISCFNCIVNDLFALHRVRDLKNTKSLCRHLRSIVERKVFHIVPPISYAMQ